MLFYDSLVKRAIVPEYPMVQHTADDYIGKTAKLKVISRLVRKYLLLMLTGQLWREISCIPEESDVLFIYVGKRNFGDALLELSGRKLLEKRRTNLDLLTLPHLADLFSEDKVFRSIYIDPLVARKHNYDYILISEFNQKSIVMKVRYFPFHKFGCMFRFFYGPDRNQAFFSYFSINHLFGLSVSDEDVKNTAGLCLWVSENSVNSVKSYFQEDKYIVVAVGGIDVDRTYQRWEEVLERLDKSDSLLISDKVVLLGSSNGVKFKESIDRHQYDKIEIISLVNMLDLKQCKAVIDRASVFIGTDGGLMHVAHTTNTATLVLFGKEASELRLTRRDNTIALQANSDVNEIQPVDIAEKVIGLMLNPLTKVDAF